MPRLKWGMWVAQKKRQGREFYFGSFSRRAYAEEIEKQFDEAWPPNTAQKPRVRVVGLTKPACPEDDCILWEGHPPIKSPSGPHALRPNSSRAPKPKPKPQIDLMLNATIAMEKK